MALNVYTNVDFHHNRLINTPDAFDCVECTREEYELMKLNGTLSPTTFYCLTDDVQGSQQIVRLSKAEYEQLVNEGLVSDEILYFVYDDDDPFISDTIISTNKSFSNKHLLEIIDQTVDDAIHDDVEAVVEAKAGDVIEEKVDEKWLEYLQILEPGEF